MLKDIKKGYLPTTVAVYGPPGTGKPLTVRRIRPEFADRHQNFEFEDVHLKECRTLFSVAKRILYELAGERVEARLGLDGAFQGI